MKKLFTFLFVVMIAVSSKATVIFDETFDYAADSLDAAAVTTWSTSADRGNGHRYFGEALSYTDAGGSYVLSGLGQSVQNNYTSGASTGYFSTRAFAAVNSGVVYLSYLYKVTVNQSQSQSEIMGLSDISTESKMKAWAGKLVGGNGNPFKIGVTRASRTAKDIKWDADSTKIPNTTYLIVLKYDFSTKEASLFVNPLVGSLVEPTPSQVNSEGTSAPSSLGYLMIKSSGNNGARFQVGGVRVSTSWSEAVATSALKVNTISPENGSSVAASIFTTATITFNKNVTKGTGVITLFDGTSSTNIALNDVEINDNIVSVPVSLTAGKTYTLTAPVGAFKAGTDDSPIATTTFNAIAKAEVNLLINENFDGRQLNDANWDDAASSFTFSSSNLFYEAGYSASLTVTTPSIQTVEFPNGVGSLVYWIKSNTTGNTTLTFKVAVDKGSGFEDIASATEIVKSAIFVQRTVNIDYNGPIKIKMYVEGTGTVQTGLDNITLTPYNANKLPVIEDFYTNPRFANSAQDIKITAKITDTDISYVEARWGVDANLTGGAVPMALNGGMYETTEFSPALSAGQNIYYQVVASDAASIVKSDIYKAPIGAAQTNTETFSDAGFNNFAAGTVTVGALTYTFANTSSASSDKLIDGKTVLMPGGTGIMTVVFPTLDSFNIDVRMLSGSVKLEMYKGSEAPENLLETVSIVGTPWVVTSKDISINLNQPTTIIFKNASSGQTSIDNLRWSPYVNTSIDKMVIDSKVVSELYYTLTGLQIKEPNMRGIYIKKVTYEDGSVKTFKFLSK